MYDYPPEYDQLLKQDSWNAFETHHGYLQVAWTEDDDVFIRKHWAPHPDREDGYQHIGTLQWEDREGDSWAENEAHNTERLHALVQDYKDRMRRETGETFVPPYVRARSTGKGE